MGAHERSANIRGYYDRHANAFLLRCYNEKLSTCHVQVASCSIFPTIDATTHLKLVDFASAAQYKDNVTLLRSYPSDLLVPHLILVGEFAKFLVVITDFEDFVPDCAPSLRVVSRLPGKLALVQLGSNIARC